MAKSEKKRRKVFGFHTAFNKASKVQQANAAAMAEYLKK
jgi:hypothetical protein